MYAALCILIVVLLLYYYCDYKWSYHNTVLVQAPTTNEAYHVHREHADSKGAAELMSQIVDRNQTFIKFLQDKYLGENLRSFNSDFGNKIDVVGGSSMYYTNPVEKDVATSIGDVAERERIQERVVQLANNYDPEAIYEISPNNRQGYTSYTQDKKTLILCLRNKLPDANGNHTLHDVNTMMFVVLHELTHMMNDSWGHPYEFWQLFKFVLVNAAESGIYTPVDYSKKPINYCGLGLTYNPMFDKRLTAA